MKYNKETKRYVIIPELLGLKTNVADFIPYFSLGAFMHTTYDEETKINLDFKIVKDFEKPQELDNRIGNFWGANNVPKIYYEKRFSERIRFKMLIEKTDGTFFFTVNKLYFKYCPFRIDRICSSGERLQNAAIFCLANLGFTILYGACVSKHDQGILLIGGSKMGKSLTAFSAIKKGYSFLSEDILALNESCAYASPLISYKSRFSILSSDKQNNPSLLKLFLGFVRFFLFPKTLSHHPIGDFLREGNIIRKTKIRKIIIFEKGDREIIKLEKDECLRKILALNRERFSYYHDTFLRVFSYFNPEIKIEVITMKEERILFSIVNQSDCYLLKVNNPEEYIEILDEI